MGIYQRDNINYGGMLGNAMANRMAYAQRDADIQRQMGQNWGNALNQGAQGIAAGLNAWNQQRIDQDKLAQQQQFQAEQRALERANELKRAQEQQKWQAEQNALNRQNTYDIAELNRQNAREDRISQNVMNYQNQEAIMKQLQFEYDNTSAKTPEGILKRAQLQSQIEQANNRLNYYGGLIPPSFRQQTQTGPTVISGPDAEKALEMFETEAPKTAAQIGEDNDKYVEVMKGPWTNANKAEAIRLAGNDQAKLQEIANKGLTVEERNANAAKELANAQASFDKDVKRGPTGNPLPGSLSKWKKANPKYAKALGY